MRAILVGAVLIGSAISQPARAQVEVTGRGKHEAPALNADEVRAARNPTVGGNASVVPLEVGAVEVIHDYVKRTRGWSRSEYRIDPEESTGDQQRYWIVHVDDEQGPGGRRQKSFAVDYDPRKHEVTREWRFQ